MNCPSCGAPLPLDPDEASLTCAYCKSIYFGQQDEEGVRVLDQAEGESCPVCQVPLMHAALRQERLRYCTRCRGMLIPMAAFLALVEELRAGSEGHLPPRPADPKELARMLDCPACHRPMETHFYGGPGNVVISDCSPCCLNWLDHGKLMRIVRAPGWVQTSEIES